MLFVTVPFSIFLAIVLKSFIILVIPFLTFPVALISFHVVNFLGEGTGKLLYGGGSDKKSYAESGFFEADMQKANAKRREKKYEEAIDMYRKIYELAPGKPDPLFELAQTYKMAENWDRARYNYMKLVISFEDELGSDNFFVSESRTQGLKMVEKIIEEKEKQKKKGGNGGGDAGVKSDEIH